MGIGECKKKCSREYLRIFADFLFNILQIFHSGCDGTYVTGTAWCARNLVYVMFTRSQFRSNWRGRFLRRTEQFGAQDGVYLDGTRYFLSAYTDSMNWFVSMYVCMSRLAPFICISGTTLWNLIKLCVNINLWYDFILPFHNVNLRGQTKVVYIKICYRTSSFICISGYIFWNLTKHSVRLSPQRSNKCDKCINML